MLASHCKWCSLYLCNRIKKYPYCKLYIEINYRQWHCIKVDILITVVWLISCFYVIYHHWILSHIFIDKGHYIMQQIILEHRVHTSNMTHLQMKQSLHFSFWVHIKRDKAIKQKTKWGCNYTDEENSFSGASISRQKIDCYEVIFFQSLYYCQLMAWKVSGRNWRAQLHRVTRHMLHISWIVLLFGGERNTWACYCIGSSECNFKWIFRHVGSRITLKTCCSWSIILNSMHIFLAFFYWVHLQRPVTINTALSVSSLCNDKNNKNISKA